LGKLGKIHSSLKRRETLALANLPEAFALIEAWPAKAGNPSLHFLPVLLFCCAFIV
jgi:hypothetical protein